MGLLPREYYALTHKEFNLMCEGFLNKKKEQSLEAWRQIRFSTWYTLISHCDRKSLPATMQQFLPLEGDTIAKPKEYNPEILKKRIQEELNR